MLFIIMYGVGIEFMEIVEFFLFLLFFYWGCVFIEEFLGFVLNGGNDMCMVKVIESNMLICEEMYDVGVI